MNISWRLFSDAHTECAAQRHLAKVQKDCSITTQNPVIQPYHKGGYTIEFSTPLESTSWPEQVFETLRTIQRLGYGWHLSGDIEEEVDAWSDRISISGVYSAHAQCMKE